MKFSDLEPVFMRRDDDEHFTKVESVKDANGVRFLCPKCFKDNGGAVGTHQILCWSPDVPQSTRPKPGRWQMKGTGADDLSLVAGSSSVWLQDGCQAHFFVENGKVRMA